MPTLNINGNIRTNTAAGWAADATVYTAKTILVTTDATYGATDQRKFKIADGTQTWAQLDYFPVSGYDDAISSIQTQLNAKLTSANIVETITNGVTTNAPSENAVFDALALKQNIVAGVDDTEIGYLNGVTSAIQTQFNSISSGNVSFPRRSNSWYCAAVTPFSPGTQSQAKDVIRLVPFIVPVTTTFVKLGMEITGAGTAGSVVRLGIYDSSAGYPTTINTDGGTIAGDSATNQTVTISASLTPALYYLAFYHNSTAAITFRSIPFSSFGIPLVLGLVDGSFSGNIPNMVNMSYTYDGTFPTISGSSVTGNNVGLLAIKTA